MKVFNVVIPHGKELVIVESGAIEIPALNYGVKIAISADEAAEAITADKLILSISFDVQDEELFFNEITLNKVSSQSDNYMVFAGGCFDSNNAFYSVTAVTAVNSQELNFYFSTNF